MGYSMATRSDMKYQAKNDKKTELEREYPDTLMGNIKLAGSAIKTFLTGGSPTQPPKMKKR